MEQRTGMRMYIHGPQTAPSRKGGFWAEEGEKRQIPIGVDRNALITLDTQPRKAKEIQNKSKEIQAQTKTIQGNPGQSNRIQRRAEAALGKPPGVGVVLSRSGAGEIAGYHRVSAVSSASGCLDRTRLARCER